MAALVQPEANRCWEEHLASLQQLHQSGCLHQGPWMHCQQTLWQRFRCSCAQIRNEDISRSLYTIDTSILSMVKKS